MNTLNHTPINKVCFNQTFLEILAANFSEKTVNMSQNDQNLTSFQSEKCSFKHIKQTCFKYHTPITEVCYNVSKLTSYLNELLKKTNSIFLNKQFKQGTQLAKPPFHSMESFPFTPSCMEPTIHNYHASQKPNPT